MVTILPQIKTQIPETSCVPIMKGLLPNLSIKSTPVIDAINSTKTFKVKFIYTLPVNSNVADANVNP